MTCRIVWLVLSAVLLLGGCGTAAGTAAVSGAGAAPTACPVPSGPIAIAASGRQGSPAPNLPADVAALLAAHAVDVAPGVTGPAVTVIGVDGDPAVAEGPHAFRTDAGNDAARDEDRAGFLAGVATAVAAVRAQQAEVDDLSALGLAGRAARGPDGSPGTVVLLDSGLQTVAPLNFREPGLLDADPDEVVGFLRAHGTLPDLRGHTVLLRGTGDVSTPQPPLGAGRREHLAALWVAVATAAGATCVDAGGAPATGDTPTDVPPVSPVPVPEPETPDALVSRLPDDQSVGFQPGTADLRDPSAAAGVLAPVAQRSADRPDLRLTLVGTTARDGTQAYQVDLARRRAESIRAALVELGADPARIDIDGKGSWFDGYVPDRDPSGALLPGPAARNRNVLLVWATR